MQGVENARKRLRTSLGGRKCDICLKDTRWGLKVDENVFKWLRTVRDGWKCVRRLGTRCKALGQLDMAGNALEHAMELENA